MAKKRIPSNPVEVQQVAGTKKKRKAATSSVRTPRKTTLLKSLHTEAVTVDESIVKQFQGKRNIFAMRALICRIYDQDPSGEALKTALKHLHESDTYKETFPHITGKKENEQLPRALVILAQNSKNKPKILNKVNKVLLAMCVRLIESGKLEKLYEQDVDIYEGSHNPLSFPKSFSLFELFNISGKYLKTSSLKQYIESIERLLKVCEQNLEGKSGNVKDALTQLRNRLVKEIA